jgi:hypothetical protein
VGVAVVEVEVEVGVAVVEVEVEVGVAVVEGHSILRLVFSSASFLATCQGCFGW